MAEEKPKDANTESEERLSLSKEELQNMKFQISIEVPKQDFDELLKAMLGMEEETTTDTK